MAAKTAMIRARITPDLKREAEKIFKKLGITVTEAISLFYSQVGMTKSIPFDVKVPNRATRKALEEVRGRKNLVKSDINELRKMFQ